MNDNLTDITFLLDRTGSMRSRKEETIQGFNAFIEDQRTGAGDCLMTLIQFDSDDPKEIVYEAKPIAEAPFLSNETFVPRGWTPLRDALGYAIVKTGERLDRIAEKDKPSKVIFVVFTDGEENWSREYTQEKIREMVNHQRDKYNWQFIFIGADIDAFAQGGGIAMAAPMTIGTVGITGMSAGLSSTSENIKAYRVSSATGSLHYTKDQRDEAETGTDASKK